MSKRLVAVMAVTVAMLCWAQCILAQAEGEAAAPEKATSIVDKTRSMQKMPGYFNIYWDAKQGKLWLEIDKWGTEFLYQSSLPAGGGLDVIWVGPGGACGGRRGEV